MNLKKCENGHYYNADKYSSCPHCNNDTEADEEVTVNVQKMDFEVAGEENGFEKDQNQQSLSLKRAIGAVSYPVSGSPEEDSKTVRFYGGSTASEPVVGWLVCIEGHALGKGFELKTGKNFIGRSNSMDIVLEGDSSVSRERHGIITYEPKERKFIAQPGESRELFYLNENVVLENVTMKNGDILLFGKTLLKFVPFCGPDFGWEK